MLEITHNLQVSSPWLGMEIGMEMVLLGLALDAGGYTQGRGNKQGKRVKQSHRHEVVAEKLGALPADKARA